MWWSREGCQFQAIITAWIFGSYCGCSVDLNDQNSLQQRVAWIPQPGTSLSFVALWHAHMAGAGWNETQLWPWGAPALMKLCQSSLKVLPPGVYHISCAPSTISNMIFFSFQLAHFFFLTWRYLLILKESLYHSCRWRASVATVNRR